MPRNLFVSLDRWEMEKWCEGKPKWLYFFPPTQLFIHLVTHLCIIPFMQQLYIATHSTKHHGVIRKQKSSQHWQVKIGLFKTYSPYASLPKKLLASWGYLEISYSKIIKQPNSSTILMLLIQPCSSVTKWWDIDPVKEEVCVLLTMNVNLAE